MASTAINDPEMMKERLDSERDLIEKVDCLAELVRKSQHFVAFTGAGISTSAGIPDFRGPEGKWTREAKGLKPLKGVSIVEAYPTRTHMAFLELYNRGVLKYMISQNCDGLHRRSGLPASAISELHGNCWVEICEDCGQQHFRDFKCTRFQREGGVKNPTDHFTGRFCTCGGRLLNSTIDFGQSLPRKPLDLAIQHSMKADLHVACGSSLMVNPACGMPKTTKLHGGKLVIVNLQKTPLTNIADMQIYAPTDRVITLLMERLSLPIPQFRLLRRIVVGMSDTKGKVYAKGVDFHDPTVEVGHIRTVNWDGNGVEEKRVEYDHGTIPHEWRITDGALLSFAPTFHFVGHFHEPPLDLSVDLTNTAAVDISLSFNPYDGTWNVLDQIRVLDGIFRSPQGAAEARIPDYGESQKEYCVKMAMKHKGCSQEEAEDLIAARFETARREALTRMRQVVATPASPKASSQRPSSQLGMAGRAALYSPPKPIDIAKLPRNRSTPKDAVRNSTRRAVVHSSSKSRHGTPGHRNRSTTSLVRCC